VRSRNAYLALVVAVLAGALALRGADPRPVARLRLLAFDTFQQLAPRTYDPNLPVRIIDIDDQSLDKLGQWPWPRSVMADLINTLADQGAVTVGFDIVFAEPDRLTPSDLVNRWPPETTLATIRRDVAASTPGDTAFAASLKRVPTTLGFIAVPKLGRKTPQAKFQERAGVTSSGDDPLQFVPQYETAVVSMAQFQAAAQSSASLNWLPDADQIVRQVPLVIAVGKKLYPSLAGEAIRLGQSATRYHLVASNAPGETSLGHKTGISRVEIGNVVAPTNANGQLWLRFTRAEPRRSIPAWKLLAGLVPREEIEGRIILVGTSAAGLFDLRTTPLDVSISGVEIHAQAIEQLASGDYLHRPDFIIGAELVMIAILGILMAAFVYFAGAAWSSVFGAASVIAVVTAAWQAYIKLGWLVDPVYPSLTITALYLGTNLYLHLKTEGERNQVRRAFGQYLAPSLVEELARNPDKLRLGGEMRNVTLMFCDIRNFTSFADGKSAEHVTEFLNSILSPLSAIILDHRGTIDKYMGDAVMAFWNAPLDDANHGRNAALAALAMQNAIDHLNEQRTSRTANGNEQPIRVGIGLNTAQCCVGNLGTEMRFDYSVIGDGVNIASRLEALSKVLNFGIIVGWDTVKTAPDLAFLEVDFVTLKGKAEPLRVFALLGDATYATSHEFQRLEKAHLPVFAAYRDGRLAQCLPDLAQARKVGGIAFATLYDRYVASL